MGKEAPLVETPGAARLPSFPTRPHPLLSFPFRAAPQLPLREPLQIPSCSGQAQLFILPQVSGTWNCGLCPHPWLPTKDLQEVKQKHAALPGVEQLGTSLGTRPGKQPSTAAAGSKGNNKPSSLHLVPRAQG